MIRRLANALELRGSDAIRGTLWLPWPWRTFLVMPRQYPKGGCCAGESCQRYPRGRRSWHRLRVRTCLATWWFKWSARRWEVVR